MLTPSIPESGNLLELRRAGQHRPLPSEPDGTLRITVLASCTADPLVPYLDAVLAQFALPARTWVAPVGQMVQQCLDDAGATAASRPDVLVVAPRIEEVWPSAESPGGDPAQAAADLLTVADTAVSAGNRWQAAVVFVLPAFPVLSGRGVGDDAACDGTGEVAAAREALRAFLRGKPSVFVVDMEEIIRMVGTRHAHHPALFRLARVPYSDLVYALLAQRLARLVRLRMRGPYQALLLDGDSLLAERSSDGEPWTVRSGWETLLPWLRRLRDDGVAVGLRHTRGPAALWERTTPDLVRLADDVLTGWVIDDQPAADAFAALTAVVGADPVGTAVATCDPQVGRALAAADSPSVLMSLDESPDAWPGQLHGLGLLDVLREGPAVGTGDGPAPSRPGENAVDPAAALARFRAGLHLELDYRAAAAGDAPELVRMLQRTHDLTLGTGMTEEQIAAVAADDDGRVLLVRVRDRFGDHGTAAAVAVSFRPPTCLVHLFLVSCPVLGRGVEEALVERLVTLAEARGCSEVVFRYRLTSRNQEAVAFLHRTAGTPPAVPAGGAPTVRIEVVRDQEV